MSAIPQFSHLFFSEDFLRSFLTMSVQKSIKLEKPADWPTWISFVRTRAQTANIWDLINPDNAKSECLTEPVEPTYVEGPQWDAQAFEIYKARSLVYTKALAKYEKQRAAFGSIVDFIQQTISSTAAIVIHDVDAHPWNLLRALKARLAPADDARHYELEVKYHNLRNGPGDQDIEKWLDTWQLIYIEGRALRVEKTLGARPIRDFILSVMKKDHAWGTTQLAQLRRLMLDETNFLTLVEDYRQYARMTYTHQTHTFSHAAFATDAAGEEEQQTPPTRPNNNTSFKGQNQPPECVCGLLHWYNRCYYLNPKKRPANWSPNAEIQNKVNEALKDEKFKAKVNANIKRADDFEKERNKTNEQKPSHSGAFGVGESVPSSYELDENNPPASFAVVQAAAFSSYPLQSSWILDNGSDTHICNRTMAGRFRKTRDTLHDEGVIAGATGLKVHSYGEIDIFLTGPKGEWKVTLTNVCYIPNFMTNVVSARLLRQKEVFFNDQELFLHFRGKPVAFLKHKHGHDLLVDNSTDSIDGDKTASPNAILIAPAHEEGSAYSTSSTTNAPIRSETAHSNDIIQHPQAAEGVIAEGVIADIVDANFPNANFPNANFPNANFPNHSIEKSANASDKGENTDQVDSYVAYFTPVATPGIDSSSTSPGVGNSVAASTNQLSSSRVRKKFVPSALTFQNISPKKRVRKPPKKSLSTKSSHDQHIIRIASQSHLSAQHRPQPSLVSSKGKEGEYNDQMDPIIRDSRRFHEDIAASER